MSSLNKDEMIAALGELVMRWQDATQRYDELVGTLWRLSASERLCLAFLMRGAQTASAIAAETRLTPASVTALIDRLAERGFVQRRADPHDRRKVMVEAAASAHALVAEAYLPLQREGAAMLARHSEAELAAFAKVLTNTIALQDEMTAQLAARKRG